MQVSWYATQAYTVTLTFDTANLASLFARFKGRPSAVSGEGYDERAAGDGVECRMRGGPSKSVEQRFRLRIVHEENMRTRERRRHEN